MRFRWLIAGFVACSAGCTTNLTKGTDASILYIPLQVTSYVAVTVDNIGVEASCALHANPEAFKWLSYLEPRAHQQFDRSNVRAKIRIGTDDLYVDSRGVVLAPTGSIELSQDETARLIASLEALRKASTCDRYDWLDD